jgi:cytochrome oxidase Cu insertion factor (SCO1/SenC/PrrC family)
VVVAALLGAGLPRAHAEEATAAAEAVVEAPEVAWGEPTNPFSERFPNVVLRTHEGQNVRFYDDLLKGKIVLVNFMYATCTER